jgi:signal transduction histidine kinase
MSEIIANRRKVQKVVLELFTALTKLPIGLFEKRDDGEMEPIVPICHMDNYEPYCKKIRSMKRGKSLCNYDECDRAGKFLNDQSRSNEKLTLCHAGMYNMLVKIIIKGETRGVLSFGEMHLKDHTHQERAEVKYHELLKELKVGDAEEKELRRLFDDTKKYSIEKLKEMNSYIHVAITNINNLFNSILNAEDNFKTTVSKVRHDIQTRLQAVVSEAEPLAKEFNELTPQEIQQGAIDIYYTTLALSNATHNLGGDYLGEYQFRRTNIKPILEQAKKIYGGEARHHGIDIFISSIDGKLPELEVSSRHIEYAINNLVHNAVKYSFRSGPNRHRYVRIYGIEKDDKLYQLVFENYGVGILSDEIEEKRIFQDGYQGVLTQKEYRSGSGKGLYFTKEIIERHHGTIKVESYPMANQTNAEGQPYLTKFIISLPVIQE